MQMYMGLDRCDLTASAHSINPILSSHPPNKPNHKEMQLTGDSLFVVFGTNWDK